MHASGPEAVKEDLERVIRPMVDDPSAVRISSVPMRRATIFEVTTAPDDLGQIIGRKGRIARAIRTLLDCRGESEDAQYGLDILDD